MIVSIIAPAVVMGLFVCAADAQIPEHTLRQPAGSAIDRIVNAGASDSSFAQYDQQVMHSSFEQARPLRPITGETQSSRMMAAEPAMAKSVPTNQEKPNFIEREKQFDGAPQTGSGNQPSQSHFGKTIANIGMNLAFVLLVGIGFIVFAKQWVKPQREKELGSTENRTSKLEVQEELMLDGKTKIRVVRWKNSDVLVASDSDGVKSMVALVPSFSESLDHLEAATEEPQREDAGPTKTQTKRESAQPSESKDADSRGVDDRLIQMLLESANRSAKASKSYSRKGSP